MGVITKKQQARLMRERRAFKPSKRKIFNPEWDDPNDIAHPLDDDIVQALRKQEKCTDLIDLFSQDLDPHMGEFHFRWSDEDISQLWLGIIERSLKLLRDAAPNTDDHNTEWIWWFSLQAKYVCACVGFDHSIFLRELIGRFGIPSELGAACSRLEWRNSVVLGFAVEHAGCKYRQWSCLS